MKQPKESKEGKSRHLGLATLKAEIRRITVGLLQVGNRHPSWSEEERSTKMGKVTRLTYQAQIVISTRHPPEFKLYRHVKRELAVEKPKI